MPLVDRSTTTPQPALGAPAIAAEPRQLKLAPSGSTTDQGPEAVDHPTITGLPGSEWSIRRRTGPWRDALRRRMLLGADLVALATAFAFVALTGAGPGIGLALALLPAWVLLAKLFGLYDQDHRALRHLTVDELRTLATWAITGATVQAVLLSMLAVPGASSGWAIRVWATVLVAVPIARVAARFAWRAIVPAERAILVGNGPLADATRRKLALFPDIHVNCVDAIDDADLPSPEALAAVSAQIEAAFATQPGVERVIIASQNVSEPLLAHQVKLCRRAGVKLSVVPPARGMFGTAVRLHHIADLPMIEYSTWDAGRSTMALKRGLDVAVSALALVLLSPLLLIVALAVRATSSGPALFVQERAGLGGRSFRMLKFRTMVDGADRLLSTVVDVDGLEEPMFKLRQDPRVTRLGRFLRRTSLDELPQLLNVLRGDMALVGPRPEQLDLVERYDQEQLFRLAVKPGLTGPMQVFGRGELSFQERLAVEREYVENLSLGRDLRIVLLTAGAVVRAEGAY